MSGFDSVLNNVARHILLTEEEIAFFTSRLRGKQVRAGSFLLKQGEECRYFYYVNKGALRAFYTAANEKESTVMFALPDWWITDMYCFVNSLPAMMHIGAIADSSVWQLEKMDLDHLLIKIPKLERYFRILMQNAYTREQLRMIENLSLSALERYNRFLLKYPEVVRQVTQKQIASYLGISAEFLSSIKRKKTGGS